jgi:sporulation protein YlmC with PRC-barrel domain
MKKIKLMTAAIIGLMASFSTVEAQNYKAPKIDASGIITVDGKHVGTIKDSTIANHEGQKIAIAGTDGILIDHKGKKLGKSEKNGNFVYFEGDEHWTISDPDAEGYCEVKDKAGNVVGTVHKNYKQQGACAIHCLTPKH